jgi:hypothetical protein
MLTHYFFFLIENECIPQCFLMNLFADNLSVSELNGLAYNHVFGYILPYE